MATKKNTKKTTEMTETVAPETTIEEVEEVDETEEAPPRTRKHAEFRVFSVSEGEYKLLTPSTFGSQTTAKRWIGKNVTELGVSVEIHRISFTATTRAPERTVSSVILG